MKIQMILTSVVLALGSMTLAQTDLETEKKLSAEYLAAMALEKDAVVLDQGVVLRPIFKSSSTVFPVVTNTVHVSYMLSDREGQILEESVSSDEDLAFPLERLIKCWQIAVPQIPVGSLYKISCPSDTAYGDEGVGDGLIKPGAALTFRITVFGIQ